jgi:hypothetical protein
MAMTLRQRSFWDAVMPGFNGIRYALSESGARCSRFPVPIAQPTWKAAGGPTVRCRRNASSEEAGGARGNWMPRSTRGIP